MKVLGTELTGKEQNFLKELLGEKFMSDVRAETTLIKICGLHRADIGAVIEGIKKALLLLEGAGRK